ncbi:MAG: MerR family transcriptional regulator [Tannerellaceae bacterium]|jgi:DNA-binding transcriptional MerR regulator|nr:MerR family transcriptional regulator [Tannerellaceae bacterium]
MQKKNKELKIHFSIGEVAEMFGLNESTIRYWEKEFDMLKPSVVRNGTRKYNRNDIEVVRKIFFLVKKQKMTLEGARAKLKVKGNDIDRQLVLLDSLERVRAELISIKTAFDAADIQSEQPE